MNILDKAIGPYVESAALVHARQAVQVAGLRKIRDPDIAARTRPAGGFVAPLDSPLDVESPGRLAGLETQGLEGDGHLRFPAGIGNSCCGIPNRVPLVTEALVVIGDLAVRPGARGIYHEEKTVSLVEERVQHEHHIIIDFQIGVAGQLSCHDFRRRPVPAGDAEIYRVPLERTRTSVLSDAGSPSRGTTWVRAPAEIAFRHAASSSRPSTKIFSSTALALTFATCLSPAETNWAAVPKMNNPRSPPAFMFTVLRMRKKTAS